MFVWPVIRDERRRRPAKVAFLSIVGLALSTAPLSGLTRAEPPPTSIDERTLPQVTVEAQRKAIEHQAYDFVRKATQNPRFQDESLPRWNAPLCFAVAGLPAKEGLYALGRLAEIARTAGARVANAGCKYNFIVVFAAQPDTLLNKAFRLHPKSFDRCGGLPEIKKFLAPSKPGAVRVWHNSRLFTRDGIPIGSQRDCGGMSFDNNDFPISNQYLPSRIERYDVFAFSLALVIVDTAYPQPVRLGQLVDYAAMVGLADIALDASLGDAPSILRIFDQPPDAQPSGLTHWDEAFLSGLYHSDQATQTQRSQIAVKMSHDILP